MLTAPIAHVGRPPAPHDLWSAWNPDPLVVGALLVAVWLYQRGRTPGRRPSDVLRARCFWAAMAAVAVALVSPVDRMSTALASAHMVQHVLLVLVAAPLLALSAPASTLLRGSPLVVRQSPGVLRRRLARGASTAALLRQPGAVWLAHVATLWFWHAAVPYDAALASGLIHAVEHGTFLLTGVLFWRTVVGGRTATRVVPGFGVLLIFGMAMQSVLLSLLLTFARTPWYAGYATTTRAWGLDPLADQQLAGVIMWVPAGAVYVVAALLLLVAWVRASEGDYPA